MPAIVSSTVIDAREIESAMVWLPTLWGRLMNLEQREQVANAVGEARSLDPSVVELIRRRARLASQGEQSTFLRMLVSAWPNASQNDLAGYGLQLSQDVAEAQPSVYALDNAGRTLRRTLKFLPSISEVLDAVASADQRLAGVMRTIDKIPEALERAERDLLRERRANEAAREAQDA